MSSLPEHTCLGELTVVGKFSEPLMRALSRVGNELTSAFEKHPTLAGKSRQACIAASELCVTYLRRCGFGSAKVVSVIASIQVAPNRFLTVGTIPGLETKTESSVPHGVSGWEGHAVAAVPSEGIVVDVTLFPAARFSDQLLADWPITGMVAVPLQKPQRAKPFDRDAIAWLGVNGFSVLWLACPERQTQLAEGCNREMAMWQRTSDAVTRGRRAMSVAEKQHAFTNFQRPISATKKHPKTGVVLECVGERN